MDVQRAAQLALQHRLEELGGVLDADGRADEPRSVVVRTVDDASLARALDDVRAGSGGELEAPRHRRPTFQSAYSSCALVVNVLGPWRLHPRALPLGLASGYTELRFEARRPIFDARATPPNLDVLAKTENHVVAIESKLTEYLDGHEQATFAERYDEVVEKLADPSWAAMYALLKRDPAAFHFLNADQLVKHYLGLKAAQECDARPVTLAYAYWEPADADEHEVFETHREEIETFRRSVDDPSVSFGSFGYRQLLEEWSGRGGFVAEHVALLRARYDVPLGIAVGA